jgi:hypothetical protein
MMFGKLENNILIIAQNPVVNDGRRIYNPSAEVLLELGYKPIVNTDCPNDNKIYKEKPTDSGTHITIEWEEDYATEAEEKTRPLTESEVSRMLLTQQVNSLSVNDNTALRMKGFYPEWATGISYEPGFKVRYNSKLWRTIQAHTSQAGWEPENTPSLWEQINETHEGTIDDPIPYDGNMVLAAGLYYYQNHAIYLCNRDSGNPVYHPLSDLVGLYVEVV